MDASAAEVIIVESNDQTSKDVPLKFELEKTTWESRFKAFRIWGTVENTSEVKYEYVRVIFTCKDKDKKFLGRQTWYIDPVDVGMGEVGYIEDKEIETEGRKPAIVEWKVLGRIAK